MVIARGHLTLEEFLRLPEEEPPLEYEDGRITQKVSPQGRHSVLQAELIERINGFGRPRRLARVFPELRTTFAERSRVPDIAVFRWHRIPRTPAGEVLDVVTTPPDIAIEISSPNQSVPALAAKCRRYLENDVPVAFLVDADKRHVRVFRPGQPEQVLRGDDRIDLDDIMPGFELTVAELFAALWAD